jgi:hypothetical protein
MARTTRSRNLAQLDYALWKAQAEPALEGPTTMPEREWKRLFDRGMTPEQAAWYAQTYNQPVTAWPRKS